MVDDQPDVLSFMAFTLEGAGFEVRMAADGRQAIDVQHEYAADVVVTDIFMPDMDGLELIDRIHYEFPGTAIVAISSHATRTLDYLKVARMIGAHATLPKPFSNAELLRLVRAVASKNTP